MTETGLRLIFNHIRPVLKASDASYPSETAQAASAAVFCVQKSQKPRVLGSFDSETRGPYFLHSVLFFIRFFIPGPC